jgi:hypothetical protein
MALQIALLGSAPSSDKLAPFGDAAWEIWGCSPNNWKAPRVDAWFELHDLDRKWTPGNEPYMECLLRHERVYIAREDKRLPRGIIYPREEVYEFFGNNRFLDTFMQSQVSYMLAFAIMQKPAVIGLWGIDMAAADEYGLQRPGCHFFFIEAIKRGIEIMAPRQSDIMNVIPPYAYKEQSPMYWRQKARKIELKTAIIEAEQKRHQLDQEILIKKGALSDIEYTNNTWLPRE